jgi:hypothetical protein
MHQHLSAIKDFAWSLVLSVISSAFASPGAAVLWILAVAISGMRLYSMWLDVKLKERALRRGDGA